VPQLTAFLLLIHAGAGTASAAVVGVARRHGGQQCLAAGDGRQGVVLGGAGGLGAAVGIPGVAVDGVEGDGAVVQVQRGGWGHVGRGAVLVEVGGARAQQGLLLDGPGHQLRCAQGRGGDHREAVSPRLHLQLLNPHNITQHTTCILEQAGEFSFLRSTLRH